MIRPLNAYSLEDITQFVIESGQPLFRSRQLVQWVYQKGATSYDEMTNLPASFREQLTREVPLDIPSIVDKKVSLDGSRKYVLAFSDGSRVETVGIPSFNTDSAGNPRRLTVCFSTQVGCPMGCAFCATGKEGFTRNLLTGEIVQQVLTVQRDFGIRVSNVVAMGQGEPFLNYDNVLAALRIINSPGGVKIGARHITVSTCGLTKQILSFAREPEQFTLAVSLHAADQATRDLLMPQRKTDTIAVLQETIGQYYDICRRRVSLEYLLSDGINDSAKHLQALIAFCRGLHVHINLIPLNEITGSPFTPSKKETVRRWVKELSQAGIETSVRDSRGLDIDGACGQLKNKR